MHPIQSKYFRLSALIACVFIFSGLGVLWLKNHSAPVETTSKQVKYGFTIRNKTNKPVTGTKLWAYTPVPATGIQTLDKLESSHSFETQTDKLGNQILLFPIELIPPYATRKITVTANTTHYIPSEKGQTNTFEPYLSPEQFIESNNSDIVKLANELKKKKSMETARAIFNWVSSNITYSGYIKNRKGALHTLKSGSGDCTEYMFLFIALCRANGLPARGIGGYRCTGNCILKTKDYHNWAQVFVNDRWVLADCQENIFDTQVTDYIAMNIISGQNDSIMQGYQRFRYQGDGISVRMNH
ncbi:MAG: transglutaminase domain-containing protein [Desulfobacterales bacterium]|nr:transglutaminase domain-containing protein [Desulfobacterales bacterium]